MRAFLASLLSIVPVVLSAQESISEQRTRAAVLEFAKKLDSRLEPKISEKLDLGFPACSFFTVYWPDPDAPFDNFGSTFALLPDGSPVAPDDRRTLATILQRCDPKAEATAMAWAQVIVQMSPDLMHQSRILRAEEAPAADDPKWRGTGQTFSPPVFLERSPQGRTVLRFFITNTEWLVIEEDPEVYPVEATLDIGGTLEVKVGPGLAELRAREAVLRLARQRPALGQPRIMERLEPVFPLHLELPECLFFRVAYGRPEAAQDVASLVFAVLPDATVLPPGDRRALATVLQTCDPKIRAAEAWAKVIVRMSPDLENESRVLSLEDAPAAADPRWKSAGQSFSLPVFVERGRQGRAVLRFFLEDFERLAVDKPTTIYPVEATLGTDGELEVKLGEGF